MCDDCGQCLNEIHLNETRMVKQNMFWGQLGEECLKDTFKWDKSMKCYIQLRIINV